MRDVPSLKKNWVPLSILGTLRYGFSGRNNVYRVGKGFLDIIKRGRLYKLIDWGSCTRWSYNCSYKYGECWWKVKLKILQ